MSVQEISAAFLQIVPWARTFILGTTTFLWPQLQITLILRSVPGGVFHESLMNVTSLLKYTLVAERL